MKTTIEELDEKIIVTMIGSLDTAAAIETEQTLKPVTAEETAKDVVIECQELEYIASSGLRVLLTIRQGTGANGKEVIVRGLNDEIKSVFESTGFINLFTLVD